MFRLFIKIVVSLLIWQTSNAKDLPDHSNFKKLDLGSIAATNELFLDATVLLPDGHALNKQAPSTIDIYEKINSKWQKLKTFSLRETFDFGNGINLQEKIKLSSHKSDLAIDSTLYHCHAVTKSFCVIESFQGIVTRDENLSRKVVTFTIKGSLP